MAGLTAMVGQSQPGRHKKKMQYWPANGQLAVKIFKRPQKVGRLVALFHLPCIFSTVYCKLTRPVL
jgi:hypothetical protein